MSALGHKRTFRPALRMSALPPKADIVRKQPFPPVGGGMEIAVLEMR